MGVTIRLVRLRRSCSSLPEEIPECAPESRLPSEPARLALAEDEGQDDDGHQARGGLHRHDQWNRLDPFPPEYVSFVGCALPWSCFGRHGQ